MRWLMLLLGACSPPTGPDPLVVLTVGGQDLDLASGRRYFAVSELDLGLRTKVVARPGDPDHEVRLRWETATGAVIDEDAAKTIALRGDQRVVVEVRGGERVERYLVSVTPADMPPVLVDGEPAEHFVFLTPRDYTVDGEVSPYSDFCLIVDGRGTPVWWFRTLTAAFDFRVAGDGRFTVNTVVDGEGMRSLVVDPATGAIDALWSGDGPASWGSVGVDAHEFQLRADGSVLRTINGAGSEDLTAIGGPADAAMWHSGVEEVGPGGALVARWTTDGNIDYGGLPPEVLANEAEQGVWRYGHVNSVQEVDGGWLMSLRSPNQVVLVDPATGEYVWKLGGADSDWTVVDEPRGGFYGQHSARIFEPGRLTVFDNGTNFFSPTTGDVRVVEYALDEGAMTATRTWEYALQGAGGTHFAGLVQRLDDGGTLIGWGSTQLQGADRSPSVTILGPDRELRSDLRLPLGTYTYRAYAFEGDPILGRWEPFDGP